LRISAHPHADTDDVWVRVRDAMADTFQNEVARARAAEQARLDNGWALLHQATERCRLLDRRAAEHREQARKEVEEIRASAADEAEEVLAGRGCR
jgi:F0F1-type ATP synthase membrane subunit b/b'